MSSEFSVCIFILQPTQLRENVPKPVDNEHGDRMMSSVSLLREAWQA